MERVSRQSFPDFMRESLFGPLEMTSSGFSAEAFADRHAVPYRRVAGKDVALPVWSGNGFVMHTTAADQAKLVIALMNDGRLGDREILRPEKIARMSTATTSDGPGTVSAFSPSAAAGSVTKARRWVSSASGASVRESGSAT